VPDLGREAAAVAPPVDEQRVDRGQALGACQRPA
jgi:hypothetical protein